MCPDQCQAGGQAVVFDEAAYARALFLAPRPVWTHEMGYMPSGKKKKHSGWYALDQAERRAVLDRSNKLTDLAARLGASKAALKLWRRRHGLATEGAKAAPSDQCGDGQAAVGQVG